MITVPYLNTGLPGFLTQHAVEIHVKKHHQAYIDNANKLLNGSDYEGKPITQIIQESSGALFNNVAQHYNHCFFWNCLSAKIQQIPMDLEEFFTNNFKSYDNFKAEFINKASTLFGSGWCYLYKDTKTGEFKIDQFTNANNPVKDGNIPILTVDTWEHSWYIDYENRKAEYFNKFFEHINWKFVLENYNTATGRVQKEKNLPKVEPKIKRHPQNK